jgi:hypothetical protein
VLANAKRAEGELEAAIALFIRFPSVRHALEVNHPAHQRSAHLVAPVVRAWDQKRLFFA